MFQEAGSEIIRAHKDEWFPDLGPNECDINIMGYAADCWRWTTSPGGNVWKEPCYLESCCRMEWYICKDNQNKFEDPVLQGWQSIVPCDINEVTTDCSTLCE